MSIRSIKTALSWSLASLLLLSTATAWGGDKAKDEEILKKAEAVLQAMLSSRSVSSSLLSTANCIIVLPGVKKFAVGFGGSGGHGPMSCRKTKNRAGGKWSAPAMYTISGASAGLQFGGSSSDFVLLLMSSAAVDKVLEGKIRVGNDLTAALGRQGSTGWITDGSDIVTFGRAKGFFAGTSLKGASLEPDSRADERLYDKAVSSREIVLDNAVTATPAGQSLVSLLERVGQFHSHTL
jgi:lipid-binding SYLF domain-containing protein